MEDCCSAGETYIERASGKVVTVLSVCVWGRGHIVSFQYADPHIKYARLSCSWTQFQKSFEAAPITHFQPFTAVMPSCGAPFPKRITLKSYEVTCPTCRETEAWRKADREAWDLPLLGGGTR